MDKYPPPQRPLLGAGRLLLCLVPVCRCSQFKVSSLSFLHFPSTVCRCFLTHRSYQTPFQIRALPDIKQIAPQQKPLLLGTIDLGKSINVAFLQSVSLASGSSFSSVGSITFLSSDAESGMTCWSADTRAPL